MIKHINIKISGRVHGVGFRWSAYEKFAELGLQGKAENIPGAGVLVDAEGPEDKLAALAEWCKQGPMGAKVENTEVVEVTEPFTPLKNG
jgi:acylphosphatase